jgi:hypothetical protein
MPALLAWYFPKVGRGNQWKFPLLGRSFAYVETVPQEILPGARDSWQ